MSKQEAIEEAVSKGVFTPPQVAYLCDTTAPTVRSWMERGLVANNVPNGRHKQIKATNLLLFLTRRDAPIDQRIVAAAKNCVERFGQDEASKSLNLSTGNSEVPDESET